MTEPWYKYSEEELCEKLMTDPVKGLSNRFADKKLKKYGPNIIYPVSRNSFVSYIRSVVTDFTSIVMASVGLLIGIFEHDPAGYVMAVLVVMNLGITLFTYARAHRVLEGLENYALPVTRCQRQGKMFMMAQKRLVPGDVIDLSEGDVVPADARLILSENFFVKENSIFGFASPQKKDANIVYPANAELLEHEQKNMVFADTLVVSGKARAIVCNTGKKTLVNRFRKTRALVSHEKLSVTKQLKKTSRFLGICSLASIFVCVIFNLLFRHEGGATFADAFMRALALSVSSMDEMLLAFGYIIIGCGIFIAVKRYSDINAGAVIKNASAIEKMQHLTALIVPKEAMFGSASLSVDSLYVSDDEIPFDDNFLSSDEAKRLLIHAVISTGIYGESEIKYGTKFQSPDHEAIITAAKERSLYNIGLDKEYPMIEHQPQSLRSIFSTTLIRDNGGFTAISSGSADDMLERSVFYRENGIVRRMHDDDRLRFHLQALSFAKRSLKVFAIASKKSEYNNLRAIAYAQSDLVFEGFIALSSPLSLKAAQTVDSCRRAGIKVILLCNDVNESDKYFARNMGIIDDEAQSISGIELSKMSDDMICVGSTIYRMYSGLSHDQKMRLISDLRKNGESVGMLGSTLSDIELIESADVAFAQNITISSRSGGLIMFGEEEVTVVARSSGTASKNGCEALKISSDVILSDTDKSGNGGFNAMVSSVCTAKKINKNIHTMIKYLLATQCARFICVLFSIISGIETLTTVQVLFSGLVVDLLAIIIISFEKQSRFILKDKRNFEYTVSEPIRSNIDALVLGTAMAVIAMLSPVFLILMGGEKNSLGVIFFSFMAMQFVLLWELKKDHSLFAHNEKVNTISILIFMIIVEFCVLLTLVPYLGNLFSIGYLGIRSIIAIIISALLMFAVCETYLAFVYHGKTGIKNKQKDK
ncbi:MAG: cation-transporting P-type ATPase [Clostridia bacterium]|nr:cation-transporting P-type ATPase [Clostridia bacterium]